VADKSVLQEVIGWIGDFLEWTRDTLNDDQSRRAIIADLGGDPAAVPPAPTYPNGALASVKAYRDAADPDLEALFSAIGDARSVFDALRPFVSALAVSAGMAIDEAFRALIDLLATNYLRLRNPQVYFIVQVVSFAEESTSVYGDGKSFYGRFGRAMVKVFEFIFGPVDSWLQFDLGDETDARQLSDRSLLPIAGVLAFVKKLGADDVLYSWDLVPGVPGAEQPTVIDRALARMLTLKFARTATPSSPPATQTGSMTTSLAWVPRSQGGPALFTAFGGGYQADVVVKPPWSFIFELSAASAVSVMLGGPKKFQFRAPSGATDARVALGFEARPDPITGRSHEFKLTDGTTLQLGLIRIEGSLSARGAEIKTSIRNSAFAIAPGSFDGFLGRLLPPDGVRLPFDIAVGLGTERGAFLEGEVPFVGKVGTRAVPVPPPLPPLPYSDSNAPGLRVRIPIGKSLGPVTVHELLFNLLREGPPEARSHVAEVSASVSAKIGPVVARVDRIGIMLAVTVPDDPAKANLALFDLDFGVRPPDGVGIAVDAKGVVSGGGFLFHDRSQHLYAGVMQLSLKDPKLTLTAFGLLATRLPDGSKGYSLLVFITADEFKKPYPLGMGFALHGAGGMLAINRTFNEAAMREGLKNNTLAKLLFPKDPIRNAPEIIRSLATIFPPLSGNYLFGPLAKISWNKLVMMNLALIFEFGERWRLIILGRISALLPSAANDLVRLNMDALGLIDFEQGTVEIDAQLVDSRLAHKYVLTGAMAMRMRFTRGPGVGFALAVGGFNPRFAPPVGMPKLDRVTIVLASGDNPRLTCESYFAITSNTVQFGARAHLYARAYGFSVEGEVGYDVLVQLLPFHFVADFHASIQLKRGSRNLFKVSVAGELEGPRPLRVSAKASFEILWCDFTIRFDKTLISGARPPLPPAIDAFAELKRALADPNSWTAEVKAGFGHGVTLRQTAPGSALALDPLGNLTVRQSVAPLNSARDIEIFGGAPIAGARRFKVTSARLNDIDQDRRVVKDLFAPAQFFGMSEDEKLASPSFAEMDSGVMLGSDAIVFDESAAVPSPLEYEPIVIDDEAGGTPPPPPRYTLEAQRMLEQARFGAVASAALRKTGVARFRNEELTPAVTVRPLQLVVASTADLTKLAATPEVGESWIEAQSEITRLNRRGGAALWQLVPAYEAA
jgi:hypothetical protein